MDTFDRADSTDELAGGIWGLVAGDRARWDVKDYAPKIGGTIRVTNRDGETDFTITDVARIPAGFDVRAVETSPAPDSEPRRLETQLPVGFYPL